jgi:lipoprotein signal peptidase
MTKKQLMLLIVAFACDQVSKIVISSYVKLNESIIVIKNFFVIEL